MGRFVCVRIVKANGLDLSLFQFDYDLTWAVVFMNADRTIYGRYGTRSQEDLSHDLSLEAFGKALDAVLKLHGGYPANGESLKAKAGPPNPYRIPEDYPVLQKFYGGKTVTPSTLNNCIHCHQIHNNFYRVYRSQRRPIPDELLWAYPMPDWLGLEMDLKERALVKAIATGSPAQQDGFKPGDDILSLDGQPLVSIADIQWVLKHAAGSKVRAEVRRAGSVHSLSLSLPAGWRRRGDFAWRASTMIYRPVPEGSRDLTPAERQARGLTADAVAILVVWPDRRKGLEKDDVLVEVDGIRKGMTASEFYAYAAQKKMPGDAISIRLLRGGKEVPASLPIEYRE